MRQFLADYSSIAFRLLLSPQPKRNQTFRNQRILLDGGKWEGCELFDCQLVYYGACGVSFRNFTFVRQNPALPDHLFELRGGALRGLCLIDRAAESFEDKRGCIEQTFRLPLVEQDRSVAPPGPRLVKTEGGAA